MFTKLTAELLDLVVHEKGYRLALYASKAGTAVRPASAAVAAAARTRGTEPSDLKKAERH